MRRFLGPIADLADPRGAVVPAALAGAIAAERAALAADGVPEDLAGRLARLDRAIEAIDAVAVAEAEGRPVGEVAGVWFALGERLGLDRLVGAAAGLPVRDYYDGLAVDRAVRMLGAAHRALTIEALRAGGAAAFAAAHEGEIARVLATVAEILDTRAGAIRPSRFTIAAAAIADLAAR